MDDPLDEEKKGLPDRASTEEKESTSSQEDLKALSDVVIAPISHLIKGDELIIVPDGQSFLIPYAALVDQHSRFLSETLRIRIVPSLNILMLLAECPEKYLVHCLLAIRGSKLCASKAADRFRSSLVPRKRQK